MKTLRIFWLAFNMIYFRDSQWPTFLPSFLFSFLSLSFKYYSQSSHHFCSVLVSLGCHNKMSDWWLKKQKFTSHSSEDWKVQGSPTQWTWVWVNSGSWWWTGRPGVLRFMGSWRVGHEWATELNRPWVLFCCIKLNFSKALDHIPFLTEVLAVLSKKQRKYM